MPTVRSLPHGEAKKSSLVSGKGSPCSPSTIGVFPDTTPGGSRFFLLPEAPLASAVGNTAMGAHCRVQSTSSSF